MARRGPRAPLLRSLLSLAAAALAAAPAAAAPGALVGKSIGLGPGLLGLAAMLAQRMVGAAGAVALCVAAMLLPWWLVRRGVVRGGRRTLPAPAGMAPLVRPTQPAAAVDEHAGLLCLARERFMQLQTAWDARDLPVLRELTTPEMFGELVALREGLPAQAARTEVLSLDARLLALEPVGAYELASLEFSGMLREAPGRSQMPFREVWMLARPRRGGDGCWRLARQQTLL